MAKLSIVPKNPSGINQLEIDAVLREDHEYINTPSEYPVEDGSVITDHIRQTPEQITIEAITSDTPVVVSTDQSGGTQIRDDQSNRSQLAFDTLLQMAGFEVNKQDDEFATQVNEPQIVTITTGLKVYTNMIVKNLRIPRNVQTGSSLQYVIEFRKFRRAQTEFFLSPQVSTVQGKAPNIGNSAQNKADQGKQKTEGVDDNSTLFNVLFDDTEKAKQPTLQQGLGAQ